MNDFESLLDSLTPEEKTLIQSYIDHIRSTNPNAEIGLSYGMSAFKVNGRPLVGFGKNKQGLSLYPFDPRVIRDLHAELEDFDLSKGVIRFSVSSPISLHQIDLILDVRKQYLVNNSS